MNIEKAAFGFSIEQASLDGDKLRVRGLANSFQVMRSGRIFARYAFDDYFKSHPTVDLTLMAQHGWADGTFATVGRVDQLSVTKAGLMFAGWIGGGTDVQDETRKLVGQGALKTLSLGWVSKQARWVSINDKDIDADIKREMTRAGRDEVYAYFDAEPVELSFVDVPDDPNALLAASANRGGAGIGATADTWRDEFTKLLKPLQDEIARLKASAQSPVNGDLNKLFADFATGLRTELIEVARVVLADPNSEYAERLLALSADLDEAGIGDESDSEAPACGHGKTRAASSAIEKARKALRDW